MIGPTLSPLLLFILCASSLPSYIFHVSAADIEQSHQPNQYKPRDNLNEATTTPHSFRAGSQKISCGSLRKHFTGYRSQGNEIEYDVAVSAYTTGAYCDTAATNDAILSAFTEGSLWAQQSGSAGFCIHMDHSDAWSADIRVTIWDNIHCSYQNNKYSDQQAIWQFPCPASGNWRPSRLNNLELR